MGVGVGVCVDLHADNSNAMNIRTQPSDAQQWSSTTQ